MTPENIKEVCLYAWVGEDEFGSGIVGLKQAMTPTGMIPLVAVNSNKMSQEYIQGHLQTQAKKYGKTIRLCKFVFQEEIITLNPGESA